MNGQQNRLFGNEESEFDWHDEWVGMPEFVNESQDSKRRIVVHFRCDEDVERFAALLGQKISQKQRALWFPVMPVRRYANKRYVDES